MSERKFVSKLPAIIGIVLCIFLVPILVMNITIIAKSYVNPNKVPDFFGIKPYVVVTGSMEKTIYGGDLAVMKTVDPSALKEGDIISFKDGDSVVTHRIVGMTEKDESPAFITRGDANNAEDSKPVTYSQVEGIYLFRIPKVGHLAMFMQTPIGMLVFIGVPLCGFVLFDIIRRRLNDKKDEKSNDEMQAEIESLKAQLAEKERE